MLDAQLVAAAIASREAWEKVNPYLAPEDFTPQGAFWWKLVGEWYERDRTSSTVDMAALVQLGNSRVPPGKARDTILGLARDLPAAVSPANAANVALELKRQNVGMELAAAIAASDDKKLHRLVPLYAELRAATELRGKRRQVRYEVAAPVDTLFYEVGHEKRIPLYPSALNSRTNGGALPGHHIVIYGRPEVGKSTIVLNLACGLAIAGKQRVLYVGNEDQINVLKARAVGRVCGMTTQEMEARRDEAIRLYKERGGEERLRFVQMFDGSMDDLREPIEEFEPTVLVVDQIRNVIGDGDGLTQRLEENGQSGRRLLLEYKLIGVSVAQAGASAEGKAWLGMNDLADSKTGLQGTADLLIGIGANAEMQARSQRGLSLPKNKLSSDSRAHEGVLVDVDYARCSVR